ncbi:hypothetical protein [Nocardia cyriacigeorgica]|uniref:hypothetical protein n=1 Tax=Nocardia cyriacigeorgica TaxID=135487 RepID=UPI0013CF9B84|nr:hypothetical protein [Nocardia cyriacigeorgica]NEW29403.1 hypothetical protein [Nocardia cyriacigeorgica]
MVFTLVPVAPGFTFESSAQQGSDLNDFRTIITAEAGSQARIRLSYFNHGNTVQRQVVIRTQFTGTIQFVPGQTVLVNANYPKGTRIQVGFGDSGVDIGDYLPKGNAVLLLHSNAIRLTMFTGTAEVHNDNRERR